MNTSLEEILSAPETREVLNRIAEATALDATPRPQDSVAESMAILQREHIAARIRNALDALGCIPADLSRAEWLENMAQEIRNQQQPEEIGYSVTMPFKVGESGSKTTIEVYGEQASGEKIDGRGGKREGAGRKPNAENGKKAVGKLITLYPEEWERLDDLAKRLDKKRPAVIRMALDALEEKLKATETGTMLESA